MQFTAQELKDKLLRALDADYNVVDIQAVLEVISTLEKYPVTKTQLEQTRLGKLVNDLRRKTTNKDLAKRAKKLVRKWHDFIGPSNAVNGERVAGGVGGKPELNSLPPHMVKGVLGSKPASPVSGPPTPSSGKSNVSPSSLQYTASTPGSSRPETPVPGSLHARLSPRLSTQPKPASPLISASTTAGPNSKKHSPGQDLRPDKSNVTSGAATSCEDNRPSTPSEGVSKLNVANKRKRRGPALEEASFKISKYPMPSDNADGSQKSNNNGESYKNSQTVVNGDLPGDHNSRSGSFRTSHVSDRGMDPAGHQGSPSSRAASLGADSNCETPQQPSLKDRRNASFSMRTDLLARIDSIPSSTASPHGHLERSLSSCSSPVVKTPKVKTTVQLIQELHNNAGMRLSGSETVTRIAMNQIEKEPDVAESIVPPEAKPRYRRKPGTSAFVAPPPSSDKSLSKTKTEMVQKFLMSSMPEGLPPVEPPTVKDDSLIDLIKQDDQRIASLVESQPVSDHDRSRSVTPEGLCDRPSEAEAVQEEVDPWSLLPPINPDTVDVTEDQYEVNPPLEVGVAEVDRLDSEHWPGINGQLDHECNWQPWTNTYSLPSSNDNLLHILPYVCLDND